MMSPNHIYGGFILTATVASICGENILSSPSAIAVCIVASLAPDIDNPSAPIGFMFRPLSKMINRKYGHRTITHTVFALLLSTLVCYACHFYTLIWFLGYLIHLVLDMVTLQGVPLFYPFYKNACVIPAKREDRFRTGDLKGEGKSFIAFTIIGLFMLPLVQNGFWTTYNSSWGTQKHLSNEFERSKDLLDVTYNYSIGSEDFKGRGYAIEADKTKTVLWKENRTWLTITEEWMRVKQITFTHTKKPFTIQTVNFISISADSLNLLLSQKPITFIEVISNQTAKINQNGIIKDFRSTKEYYQTNLLFYAATDSITKEKPFFNLPSATAKLKRNQIQTLRDEYADKLRHYESTQNDIERLTREAATDYATHEKAKERIEELKREKKPELDVFQIRNLEYEANIAESQDAERTRIDYEKYLLEIKERQLKKEKTVFSGIVKYVRF